MAKVDFQAFNTALANLYAKEIDGRISHLASKFNASLYTHDPGVRPGRYTKRLWRKMGQPGSLRSFARSISAWDPVVRAWLDGSPPRSASPRAAAKAANFAAAYGLGARSLR